MRRVLPFFLACVSLFAKPQILIASWYGPRHAGKRMANGQPFEPMAPTCASRTFPLGRLLRLQIGSHVAYARVTDRGPRLRGRDLDLSQAVADALGMRRWGIAFVEVEEVAGA